MPFLGCAPLSTRAQEKCFQLRKEGVNLLHFGWISIPLCIASCARPHCSKALSSLSVKRLDFMITTFPPAHLRWGGRGRGSGDGSGGGGGGWGWVKLIISNDTLSHAHFHPPSLNISKTLDGESRATNKANTTCNINHLAQLWGWGWGVVTRMAQCASSQYV